MSETVQVRCPAVGNCTISTRSCELYLTRGQAMPAWVLFECPVCMEWHHTLFRGANAGRNLAELTSQLECKVVDQPSPELGAGRPVDIDYAIDLHRELERL